jgi:hypothetical protein
MSLAQADICTELSMVPSQSLIRPHAVASAMRMSPLPPSSAESPV